MTSDKSAGVPEGLAWHYTSAAGLRGIIETHSLRATSAGFMNDANELKTGVATLRRAYERERTRLTEEDQRLIESSGMLLDSAVFSTFLVCASKEADLLTLWRYYGNDNVAYSIGLNQDIPLMPREQVPGAAHPSPPPGYFDYDREELRGTKVRLRPNPDAPGIFGGEWRDVKYVDRTGEESHTEYIRDFIDERNMDVFTPGFWFETGNVDDGPVNVEKDNAFEDEREVRILMEPNPQWKFVKFRESHLGLVPYVELTSSASANDEGYVPGDAECRLPIRHIMVGPTRDPQAAEYALRVLLDNSGYGDVTIGSSEIPFR